MTATSVMQSHRCTLPLIHVKPHAPGRSVQWLMGIAATGNGVPLFLVHDLGALLTQPRDLLTIERFAWLPEDLNTTAYTDFLNRLVRHPLIRWSAENAPSDKVVGVLVSRLTAGIPFSESYRLPAGAKGVITARRLEAEVGRSTPETIWKQTPPAYRPELTDLLPHPEMPRIEANLRSLDPAEFRFICEFGPQPGGAPNPMELQDLFALMDLPPMVRKALSQVLSLLPKVSATPMSGGLQTYAMGGYSGLTQRGSLDSLLPGELAFPGDLFLHRLLNQEALYYSREGEADNRRELVCIVTRSGAELLGDARIMARALTLALGKAMSRRGYEVHHCFAGDRMTRLREIGRSEDIHRVLYYQNTASLPPAAVLETMITRLRECRDRYRGMHVFWVVGEHWDTDGWPDHEDLYGTLRELAGQQVWYIRVADVVSAPAPVPDTARLFHRYDIVSTGLLWQK